MIYFNTQKTKKKKTLYSLLILTIFGLGLVGFFTNKNIFSNYKTYYFESYSYVIPYKFKETFLSNNVHVEANSEITNAKSVPVLLYHGVLGGIINNSEGEATNVNLSIFWDQMKALKENGWNTISISDFYAYKMGLKELPAKSFLLTFDDGRKDSYYPADPIFKALGFHAVMFVIDKYSIEENSNYYLSKAELLEMNGSPEWELESHGYSSHSEYPIDNAETKAHFFSNKLWLPDQNRIENKDEFLTRISNDLKLSKENLEKVFNRSIIAFAFPFGDYGQGTVNYPGAQNIVVEQALNTYNMAFYQYSSTYRYSQNYPEPENTNGKFMIKRIGISPHWSGKDLLNVFNSGSAKNIPFTAKLDESDGWINTTWGTMSIKDNKITIGAEPDSTGSTIILDGTNAWVDYTISVKIKWIKGSNVYIQARSKDDNNLAACNFKRDLVHVEQIYEGVPRVIAGVENKFDPGEESFTIGMKVVGRNVDCSINGKVIVSAPFLEEPLTTGGIGIKTWDNIPGNSEIIIEALSVEN